jgi:hypothetical protein
MKKQKTVIEMHENNWQILKTPINLINLISNRKSQINL